jgi:hypothetical protein
LLPFTSASGEAVCCAIIFQSKQDGVPATWTTGIDHSVQPILSADENEIELEGNFGEGKYYPGGPKCKFNGKVVDCLTFSSESGGISGDILVDILKYFDQIDLFPRVMVGLFLYSSLTVIRVVLTQSLSITSMIAGISGRFVLEFHMQQPYGKLVMHRSKMVL